MEIIETKVYDFDELSDDAKEKAIEKLYDINVNYEWFDSIYDDAENVGIKIESFDIYRKNIDIKFLKSAPAVAELIVENHGKQCDTRKTADQFLSDLNELTGQCEDIEDCPEDKIDDLEKEFKRAIAEDYLSMLSREYDYLTSREGIIETIEANEYQFTDDGEII